MAEGFECEFCGEEFSTERGLNIHKGQKHEDKEDSGNSEATSSDKNSGILHPDNLTIPASQFAIFTLVLGLALGFSGGTIIGASMANPVAVNQTADAGADSEDSGDELRQVSMENIDIKNSPTLGEDSAPIKIVEYSDYGCPFCSEFAGFDASPRIPIDQRNTLDKLKNQYIDTGQVQLIYKDYPVDSLHPNAVEAHKAANCVFENEGNEAYWDYHDALYERRDSWMQSGAGNTEETFRQISEDQGLDTSTIMQCYQNSDGSEVRNTRQKATMEFGQLGTPTFFIGKEGGEFTEISGAQSLAVFEQIINRLE